MIHTGMQVYHYVMNDLYPGNAGLAGQFSFNGQFTGNTGTTNGDPVADFLLGLPQQVQQGNGGGGNKYLRNTLYGIFLQDNWRKSKNLTLNMGLRYELTTARTTNNNQDVNFDLVSGVPKIGFGYNTYKGITNFQPRLGFAWQPDMLKGTVIRGAYGISTFMEANGVNNLPYQNPPFVQAHTANFSGLALPNSTLSQGFSGFPASACTPATLQALSPACLASNTLHLTNPDLRPAVDQQWNLSIQRQFGKNTSLQIGYVGNKIDHMSDIFIFNQLVLNPNGTTSPGPFAQSLINCCGAGILQPFASMIPAAFSVTTHCRSPPCKGHGRDLTSRPITHGQSASLIAWAISDSLVTKKQLLESARRTAPSSSRTITTPRVITDVALQMLPACSMATSRTIFHSVRAECSAAAPARQWTLFSADGAWDRTLPSTQALPSILERPISQARTAPATRVRTALRVSLKAAAATWLPLAE